MLLLRHGRTLIESNLVSNKLLEYTPDLATHPFIEYLRFGIPVCLNTDDQGSWDSNLTDEYFTAIRTFQLSWEEVVQLGRNSLNHSFAPDALKRQLLNDFDIAIKRFEQQARNPQWVPPAPIVSGYARRNLLN
jgi:adenosine deaminase CECR1